MAGFRDVATPWVQDNLCLFDPLFYTFFWLFRLLKCQLFLTYCNNYIPDKLRFILYTDVLEKLTFIYTFLLKRRIYFIKVKKSVSIYTQWI